MGVSLRKPSQPPSPAPETVTDPVAISGEVAGEAAGVVAGKATGVTPPVAARRAGKTPAGDVAASDLVAAIASDAAAPGTPSAPSTAAVAPRAATSERPSDIVALRTPAAADETQAIDAFVNGAAVAIEKAASEIPPARLAEVLRRGSEGYRELVLYLPEKLAQELSLHCLEHNLDMSRVVASAIEQHLTGASAVSRATPVGVATPVENRRADDGAPVNEGLLSLAARVLMGELAAWARAVWARRRAAAATTTASVAS